MDIVELQGLKPVFSPVFLHVASLKDMSVHRQVDPGVEELHGGHGEADIEYGVAVLESGGAQRPDEKDGFFFDLSQNVGCLYHCVCAVRDQNAGAWVTGDRMKDQIAVFRGQLETVFAQQGRNGIRNSDICIA